MADGQITHKHHEIKTEQRGKDVILWGIYHDDYSHKSKELLWLNPTQDIIDGCSAALKDGAIDLRHDGPTALSYEQYHQTGRKRL